VRVEALARPGQKPLLSQNFLDLMVGRACGQFDEFKKREAGGGVGVIQSGEGGLGEV